MTLSFRQVHSSHVSLHFFWNFFLLHFPLAFFRRHFLVFFWSWQGDKFGGAGLGGGGGEGGDGGEYPV